MSIENDADMSSEANACLRWNLVEGELMIGLKESLLRG